MLRVALLHFCFEDYTIELANALVEFVELTLIQPRKISKLCQPFLDPRIQIRNFEKPRIRNPKNFFSMIDMMRIIRDVRPDVLHVQETNDFWYDLTLLFNRMPPLVTTIHDVFRHPGDRHSVFGSEYTKRISFYRSQHLIVHAESLKDILVKQFHIKPSRITVLPHGELGSLYQRRANYPKHAREPYTLLFFGRIWPYKGLKYLLEAMPLVADQIPEVKLIIAGRGEELEQYFSTHPQSHRYEILNDFIPPEIVASLFQRSTAIVLPYIESSQSGVAALAYAMGTPVIASDIGGLGEMINSEKDGLLVPPRDVPALADAIIRLLRDRTLHQRIQKAAFERSQTDLNWANIAAQTVKIYQSLGSRHF